MRNVKFSGIKFRKDDDSGIAKINITNTTTSTGIVVDGLVDLFTADQDATVGEYESFVYWTLLDPADDDYNVTVEHSGTNNPSAVGPNYNIQIDGYLMNEEIQDGEVEAIVTMWHTSWPEAAHTYTLTPNSVLDLERTQAFNGDGSTTEFVLSETNHAVAPLSFSVDSGVTWVYPSNYNLTWGANSPDYDDETVHTSTGYFGVSFDTAPETGLGNVIIKYQPAYNKYYITRTLKQPNDGIDYKDLDVNIRLLDDAIELI